ncbi:MAG: hypothetical protein K0S56_506 [Microvirga sp.]|jgi:hypothetical protein|nr:hypothetical protein [Microvirga sp.]
MGLRWRKVPVSDVHDEEWVGGLGTHAFAVVFRHTTGGFENGRYTWSMNGLTHLAKVTQLGFADTADEAKAAANEQFLKWLDSAWLRETTPEEQAYRKAHGKG